jgi:hypothetical protein
MEQHSMSESPDIGNLDRPFARPAAPSPVTRTDAEVAETDVVPELRCHADGADEPLGGDPPCWAHLFDDET